MNLISFKKRQDCGHEWYVQILNTGKHVPNPFKNKSLLQVSVSWNDDPCSFYMQITSGNHTLLGILMWVYKIGFDLDLYSRTWTWDHLEQLDE